MASQTFTTLWKALVGAFLALFAALGLASPAATAAAPVSPQPQGGTCEPVGIRISPAPARYFAPPTAKERSLPPTMKQRIRAEQHGSSPSCRQLAVPFGLPPATQDPTSAAADTHGPAQLDVSRPGPASETTRDTAETTRTQPGIHSAGPRDDEFGTAPQRPATAPDTTADTSVGRPAGTPVGTPTVIGRPATGTTGTPETPGTTGDVVVPGPADSLDSVLPNATDAYLLPGTVASPAIPGAREHQDRPQGHTTSAGPGDSTPYVTSAP